MTECYEDLACALANKYTHCEALSMKAALDSAANELKDSSVRLTLAGRHKDALLKLTKAIATNPSVPEFHLLRCVVTGTVYKNTLQPQ